MKKCKEMIKNSVDYVKHCVYVLPLKFIFVAKTPYPTHFKIHVLVSTVGFERLVNKKMKLNKEILYRGSQYMYFLKWMDYSL